MTGADVRTDDGRYSVEASVTRCGGDVCVCFLGGEKPHIGAAALAVPRPSLTGENRISASCSVICVTGHMEDEFVRSAAMRLAAETDSTTVVCAGVHIDAATHWELERLRTNLEQTLDGVSRMLKR